MLDTRLTLVSDSISVAIKDMVARLDDSEKAMQNIGAEMETRIRARFETQTDPSGKPWAKHSPVTLAMRADRLKNTGVAGNSRILDDSGTMLASLGWDADPTSVTVGFSAVASKEGDPYAVYHEFGAPKRNLPRRGMIFEDPASSKLTDDKQTTSDIIIESMFG